MDNRYFGSLLDKILEDEPCRAELVVAKGEFEQLAGQIMESDESYDAKVRSFHHWYLLDRPMTGQGKTPLAYYLECHKKELAPEDIAHHHALAENLHSLFELLQLNPRQARIRDVLGRKKYTLEDVGQLCYLERGELFNTRLFPFEEGIYLGDYLILHPRSAVKTIHAEARQVRKSGQDAKPFLFRLLFFHSRWEQFTQMDVDKIYRFKNPSYVTTPL